MTKTWYASSALQLGTACLFVGILVGWFIPAPYRHGEWEMKGEIRAGDGHLTNPLLECDVAEDIITSRKENFQPELETFVQNIQSTGHVSDVAVYFRDLNNGPVMSVNQNSEFIPASLLKVPVMIAYLNKADKDHEYLNQTVKYERSNTTGIVGQVNADTELVAGTEYTLQALIETMITNSDNQALILLSSGLPLAELTELYSLLGVDPSVINDPSASLSVKQYSAFFRILFNASYLSRESSEWALALMTRTTFMDGLRAGVPSGVVVSHKFGERKLPGSLQQLHDCGIVYYPKHPYLLCVMTRGGDVEKLKQTIAETSSFVYKTIDGQYHESIK